MRTREFTCAIASTGHRVDYGKRVIEDVLLICPSMQGGKELWSDTAMEDVARLIRRDGVESFRGHRSRSARPGDAPRVRLGEFTDARFVFGEVRGAFTWRPDAEEIVNKVLDDPASGGFSVHVVGVAAESGDGSVVHVLSATAVLSIDLIERDGNTEPGHGRGLWEAKQRFEPEEIAEYILAAHDAPDPQPMDVEFTEILEGKRIIVRRKKQAEEERVERDDDALHDYEVAAGVAMDDDDPGVEDYRSAARRESW